MMPYSTCMLYYFVTYITCFALLVNSAIDSRKKSVQLICQYASGCKVNSDCVPGNKCTTEKLPHYSQCVPDPAKYSTNPTCLQNWGGRCSSNSDCCDPGSYCNNNWWYRQCQQPQFYAAECLPQTTAVPTSLLTAKPSFRPTLKPLSTAPNIVVKSPSQSLDTLPICQYGGFCRSTSDCALGNKCVIQSAYYSQCLPDPSQYSTTTCAPTYNTKCSASSDCCDPGAICTQIGGCPYSTCVPIQSPMCTNPVGYAALVPSLPPVAIPTRTPNFKPSIRPTAIPSFYPSLPLPTETPTVEPTFMSTAEPSFLPTAEPTLMPTAKPTSIPTTAKPTTKPTAKPTSIPTTAKPTSIPTTSIPTAIMTNVPTAVPSTFFPCRDATSCGALSTILALPSISGSNTILAAKFKESTTITTVMVDVSVVSIGSAAFLSCKYLSSIVVPTTVTSVGSFCFQGCTSLKTIQLPTSLKNLPNSLFQLSGLVSFVIPTSVITVGQVFFQAQNLSSLVIPTSIVAIPTQFIAFNNALEQLTIPTSVTSIAGGAFISCTKLNCLIADLTNVAVADGAFVSTPLGGCPTALPSALPSTA